jgi:hypothetical protein
MFFYFLKINFKTGFLYQKIKYISFQKKCWWKVPRIINFPKMNAFFMQPSWYRRKLYSKSSSFFRDFDSEQPEYQSFDYIIFLKFIFILKLRMRIYKSRQLLALLSHLYVFKMFWHQYVMYSIGISVLWDSVTAKNAGTCLLRVSCTCRDYHILFWIPNIITHRGDNCLHILRLFLLTILPYVDTLIYNSSIITLSK